MISRGASAQKALTRQTELQTCTPIPAKQYNKYKKTEKKIKLQKKSEKSTCDVEAMSKVKEDDEVNKGREGD